MLVKYTDKMTDCPPRAFDAWLLEIIRHAQSRGVGRFTCKATKVNIAGVNYYLIENRRNKTQTLIQKYGRKICARLFKMPAPDPQNFIKPDFEQIDLVCVRHDSDGVEKISSLIYNLLGQDTVYSKGEVQKLKVRNSSKSNEDKFFGGLITQARLYDDKAFVQLDNGLEVTLELSNSPQGIINIYNYIVIDNDLKYGTFNQHEFHHYCELV